MAKDVRYAKDVEVLGLAPLEAKLRAMPAKVAKKLERAATRKAARVVRDAAKALVPVESGALKKSIRVKALRRSRKNKGRVGARVVTGKEFFQGETFYGGMIEFGTARMAAEPFLRPAADASEHQVKAVFREALRQAIDDESQKTPKAA